MSKKTLTVLIFICLFLCGLGTIKITKAYLSDGEANKNTIEIGFNEIEIIEESNIPETMTVGENTYQRQIQIKNTGNVSCYVRIFAEFSDLEAESLSEISSDGNTFYSAESYKDNLPENWVYIPIEEDSFLGGYFYYIKELEPDELTDPLFKMIKTTFEAEDSVRDCDLIIYSESIQSKITDPRIELTDTDIWKQTWEYWGANLI